MTADRRSRGPLAIQAVVRLVAWIFILSALLFLPAGTVAYWQAWLYLAVLFVPMTLVLLYLLVNDPALLERRLRSREKDAEQSLIIKLGTVCYLLAFVVPGLDRRFGWSDVPALTVILADLLVLLGYGFSVWVLKVNSYASRVIEVEQGQQVVTTGPYAIVRHPMYLGIIVMFFFTPVALGSWWGVIPALPLAALLVARLLNEERLLVKELKGYSEYTHVTRYRLIPGVW